MSRTWEFTDTEFMALWSRIEGTLLPRPFTYVTDMQSGDEFERALYLVRERWRGKEDRFLDQLTEAVLQPDIALQVRGFDEREYERAEGWVRVLAVRRDDRGYVLKQVTGRTFERAAGYTVTECDPLALADRVVAELPKVKAGKQGSIKLPVPKGEEMVDTSSSGLWDDPYHDGNPVSGDRFLNTVAASRGSVLAIQGRSVYGPRGRIQREIKWRDLPDDGRYIIGSDLPPVAQPADEKTFVVAINREIAKIVQTIRDERVSHRNGV
ncbi:ESX secretion-associated protein EspG [Nocardia sp. XZ_19_385]|uniref:ESX secretion-associated protein EspG n=1 Tax=Nocardia sp. XZ_19_385 TaxID=2769488 RepID=UPI0018903B0C|nr:ESX secretion-associated protein EspG [Nocardia sp. XZ_19_385]